MTRGILYLFAMESYFLCLFVYEYNVSVYSIYQSNHNSKTHNKVVVIFSVDDMIIYISQYQLLYSILMRPILLYVQSNCNEIVFFISNANAAAPQLTFKHTLKNKTNISL